MRKCALLYSLVASSCLILVACASAVQPRSFSAPTARAAADVYACAIGQLNVTGYTLVDANKEAGFVKAEKKTSGIGRVLMSGNNAFDAITVSVFENPTTHETMLRLTAATMLERAGGFGAGARNVSDPSPALESDANTLLAMCTK